MSPKKEYGDFQTPLSLAQRVLALVEQDEKHIGTIVEPTCGVGAFLQAAVCDVRCAVKGERCKV